MEVIQIEAPYKIVIKADDYPDSTARAIPLSKGDSIFVTSPEPVHIGSPYKNYSATISQVFYKPKKWWQFWKRKEQLGYQITWN